MIVSDFLKMIIVLAFMLIINWKITAIVLLIMPDYLNRNKHFQQKDESGF